MRDIKATKSTEDPKPLGLHKERLDGRECGQEVRALAASWAALLTQRQEDTKRHATLVVFHWMTVIELASIIFVQFADAVSVLVTPT